MIWQWGAKISSEESYICTSEGSYERREYKSAGDPGGAIYKPPPPRKNLNLEPLRVNLSVI